MMYIMQSLNGITEVIVRNDHKPLARFLNGKMQKIKSIDGD